VRVRGVGLWRPAPGAETPPPRLPSRLRRRASLLINMVAEVGAQAAEQGGASLATVPLVVGSAFGELATTIDILRDIEGDGMVSPAQFQASVHNSAVGYLSIAHENRVAATSIAAGDDTVAMVLLEAMTLLALRGGQVLAIVADEALPAELVVGADTNRGAVAAAFLLEASRQDAAAGPAPLAVLEDLRAAPVLLERPVESNTPCASAAALVEAIRAGRVDRVELGPVGASSWSVAVRPLASFPPISELVPHEPPMLLLDRVLAYSKDFVSCEVEIRSDSPFVRGAGVPAIVGIEYMAQTVATFAGLAARETGGEVRIGFLLGSRDVRIDADVFPVGDRLTIDARRTWGENDLGSFVCQVRRGADVLLQGSLSVYQGPLPELPTK
jgi:predicted hotdog family 3-hydroxylacyl-ACP dehydratase